MITKQKARTANSGFAQRGFCGSKKAHVPLEVFVKFDSFVP
jgi:hypothetical protein